MIDDSEIEIERKKVRWHELELTNRAVPRLAVFDEEVPFEITEYHVDDGHRTGHLLRLGWVIQAVYANGRTDTWTARDTKSAMENFRALLEVTFN